MKQCMPEAYQELGDNCKILEKHYKDMMVSDCILNFEDPSTKLLETINFYI